MFEKLLPLQVESLEARSECPKNGVGVGLWGQWERRRPDLGAGLVALPPPSPPRSNGRDETNARTDLTPLTVRLKVSRRRTRRGVDSPRLRLLLPPAPPLLPPSLPPSNPGLHCPDPNLPSTSTSSSSQRVNRPQHTRFVLTVFPGGRPFVCVCMCLRWLLLLPLQVVFLHALLFSPVFLLPPWTPAAAAALNTRGSFLRQEEKTRKET